jgi:hypothetical protein
VTWPADLAATGRRYMKRRPDGSFSPRKPLIAAGI